MFDPVEQTMQANCYQTLGTHRGQVLTIVAAAHLVGKLWPMLIRLTYVPPVDTLCIGSMPDRMLGRGRTVRRPQGKRAGCPLPMVAARSHLRFLIELFAPRRCHLASASSFGPGLGRRLATSPLP
jgi:hypothetical protein